MPSAMSHLGEQDQASDRPHAAQCDCSHKPRVASEVLNAVRLTEELNF